MTSRRITCLILLTTAAAAVSLAPDSVAAQARQPTALDPTTPQAPALVAPEGERSTVRAPALATAEAAQAGIARVNYSDESRALAEVSEDPVRLSRGWSSGMVALIVVLLVVFVVVLGQI